jgi:hypothetical protein
VAFAYQGVSYTSREKVIDVGPLQASVDTKKTIPLSPLLGGLALVGGIVLVVVGTEEIVLVRLTVTYYGTVYEDITAVLYSLIVLLSVELNPIARARHRSTTRKEFLTSDIPLHLQTVGYIRIDSAPNDRLCKLIVKNGVVPLTGTA